MYAASIFRPVTYLNAFFFAFLFFCCCILAPVKSDELPVLLRFKSALEGPNTTAFGSWRQASPPCSFTGVVCNSGGFVTQINLPGEQLSGAVPFDPICTGLRRLEKISLGSNRLNGRLTEGLRNCSSLRYLDVSGNFISGVVPDLSPLKQLEYLQLNGSSFSGAFPWKSLQNLTRLSFLSLGDNPFDETPFPTELLKLDSLYWLYLTNCSLQGRIPESIANLTKLENLELSDNNLFGNIPKGISRLQNLKQLELYDNRLTGNLPEGFRNLTSLVSLDVSNNRLEGNLSELRFLTRLASLQLFQNQFSGEVPEELGEFKNLQEISMYSNNLSGSLPQKLGSWSEFRYIDASCNSFTGTIPPYMCSKKSMVKLLLLDNRFTGEIPELYANCSTLLRIRVSNNSLSGSVPAALWGLPNLSIIDLALNRFEGRLSPSIGEARSLAQVLLSNNLFSGELPATISKASSLVAVSLSSNRFTGQLPADIGDLKNLNSLYLQGNSFSGTIPKSLGDCISLNDINFAGNSFSGEIPATVGALPSLNFLNLSNNKLSGEIPASLSSLKLSLLDLSNNSFSGRVPDTLSVEADRGSFRGNPGLCSQINRNMRPCFQDSDRPRSVKTLISCFIAGATVLMVSLVSFLSVRLWRGRHDGGGNSMGEKIAWDIKPFHLLTFSEQDIVNSIKQENLIGKGGSGSVYRVVIKDKNILAVKHIRKSLYSADQKSCRSSAPILAKKGQKSREYDAEIATLSSVRHVNLVKLFCSISSEDSSFLVYEYLPNGSLWDRLHTGEKKEMGWGVRYCIGLGAAKGLEYLHHGCSRPIIHRDVKSSNILLDEHMKPRIADFGLAKMVQPDSCVADSTHIIAGTYGYIAPEYGYTNKVNEKSDVYSFGVVLMELVTGKRPVEPAFGEDVNIVLWVRGKITSKEVAMKLVDSGIPESQREAALKVLKIAVQCTAKLPALRPSMRMVVKMLEAAEPFRVP